MEEEKFINQCINFIEAKENVKLGNEFKNNFTEGKVKNYNRIKNCIFNYKNNFYDIAVRSNNFEALTILSNYDKNHIWFTKNSENFKIKRRLKYLFNGSFKVFTRFINKIIENYDDKKASDLLNLIFQYMNFDNTVILHFLLCYYRYKIPLSRLKLNDIMNEKKQ